MSYLKPNSWLDVLWHFLTIISVFVIIVLFIFKVYLPSYTNHGEIINVPDIENMDIEEAISTLEEMNLRYVITDTVFSPKHDAHAVVKQDPKANAEVKENRKVYLTLNQEGRPKWTFTDDFIRLLRKRSYSEVKYRLDSLNIPFRVDTIYVEHVKDYVHEIFYHRDTLRDGTKVEIGGKDRVTIQISTGEADPYFVDTTDLGLDDGFMADDPESNLPAVLDFSDDEDL